MSYKILSKKEAKLKQKPWICKAITSIKAKSMKNICKNKMSSGMKDSFSKLIFKILEVHGKELTNQSIRNQMKMRIQSSMRTEQSFEKVVSSKFNIYFVNIAQNLLRELGESNNKFQNLKDPNTRSFFLEETTSAGRITKPPTTSNRPPWYIFQYIPK